VAVPELANTDISVPSDFPPLAAGEFRQILALFVVARLDRKIGPDEKVIHEPVKVFSNREVDASTVLELSSEGDSLGSCLDFPVTTLEVVHIRRKDQVSNCFTFPQTRQP
jgi:hypothetical protein